MLETLSALPLAFWVVMALLAGGGVFACTGMRGGFGLPMLAVLATAAVWYVGDAFYNDYAGYHANMFPPDVLADAWWQVALFVASFLLLAPVVHRYLNARYLNNPSRVRQLYEQGTDDPYFQLQIERMFYGCAVVWALLAVGAAIRLGDQIPYYFFPFLDHKADPWARGRMGGGIDALLSLASYLQIFVAMAFGVVAAVVKHPAVRILALLGCLLTWPYFIFDRTRNVMLAVVVPAILAWVLLRLRGSWLKKAAILGVLFLVTQAWLAFVISNRTENTIVAAVKEKGFANNQSEKIHQEGLNMFEELCWINHFIREGTYQPNWGARYFAELVNPIPRTLWTGKPMIGIDYAVARGQSGGEDGEAGVYASISTGMIGQGVVNFGRWLGPPFVAFLLSLWVAILARLDLCGERLGYIPLYALGLILTFNMGRDITFITLYTFVFGAALVWWLGRSKEEPSPETLSNVPTRHARPSPRLTVAPFSVTAPEVEKRKAEDGERKSESGSRRAESGERKSDR